MIQLPSGWAETTLSEVCESISKHNPADRPKGRITYIDIGAIDKQRIVEVKELLGRDAPSRARQLIRAGDTVLSTVRTYLRKTALVPADLDGATASTGFCVLRPAHGIEPVFVFHRVTEAGFVASLSGMQTGSSYPAVRDADVLTRRLLLPPSAEQRRIVAAIEEEFSRLDSADQLLANARGRLRTLRSLILSQVVETPWPNARIGDVADVGSGATPRRGDDAYWLDGTIPWVISGQLTKPYVREATAFITETALRETNVRLWPKHTLLVALYGEGRTRGHCSELLIEATTNQACAAIVLKDDAVDRSYLKLFLGASYEANRRLASGGVQPNLSVGLIKKLRFPLPPLDDQRRVVANVEQQLSIIDSMTRRIEAAVSRSAVLRQSILHQAFSGKLVPQDPADEPASVLLECIAAERAAAPKPARRQKKVMA